MKANLMITNKYVDLNYLLPKFTNVFDVSTFGHLLRPRRVESEQHSCLTINFRTQKSQETISFCIFPAIILFSYIPFANQESEIYGTQTKSFSKQIEFLKNAQSQNEFRHFSKMLPTNSKQLRLFWKICIGFAQNAPLKSFLRISGSTQ